MTKTGQMGTDNQNIISQMYSTIPYPAFSIFSNPYYYASLAKLSLLTLDRDILLQFFSLHDVINVRFVLFNVICLPVFKYFSSGEAKDFLRHLWAL
jgi:hypothetical protein